MKNNISFKINGIYKMYLSGKLKAKL